MLSDLNPIDGESQDCFGFPTPSEKMWSSDRGRAVTDQDLAQRFGLRECRVVITKGHLRTEAETNTKKRGRPIGSKNKTVKRDKTEIPAIARLPQISQGLRRIKARYPFLKTCSVVLPRRNRPAQGDASIKQVRRSPRNKRIVKGPSKQHLRSSKSSKLKVKSENLKSCVKELMRRIFSPVIQNGSIDRVESVENVGDFTDCFDRTLVAHNLIAPSPNRDDHYVKEIQSEQIENRSSTESPLENTSLSHINNMTLIPKQNCQLKQFNGSSSIYDTCQPSTSNACQINPQTTNLLNQSNEKVLCSDSCSSIPFNESSPFQDIIKINLPDYDSSEDEFFDCPMPQCITSLIKTLNKPQSVIKSQDKKSLTGGENQTPSKGKSLVQEEEVSSSEDRIQERVSVTESICKTDDTAKNKKGLSHQHEAQT